MLTGPLRRGRQTQQLGGAQAVETDRLADARLAQGQRTCLVERHDVNAAELLHRSPVLHQDATLGRVPDGCYERSRRRQDQRARANDDQHGDRPHNISREEVREHRNREREGDQVLRVLVGNALHRRLCGARLAHQPDHVAERGLRTDLRNAHLECAARAQSARVDRVARGLVERQRFAGDGRLVHGRMPAHDLTVDRNAPARPYQHHITLAHARNRRHDLPPVQEQRHVIRRQTGQLVQGVIRTRHCEVLQHLPNEHHERDERGCAVLTDKERRDHSDTDHHARGQVEAREDIDGCQLEDGEPAD